MSQQCSHTNKQEIGVHTKESFLIWGRRWYWLLTCTVYLIFLSESIPMTGITNTCLWMLESPIFQECFIDFLVVSYYPWMLQY
jgi:hypothetical protein